MATYSSGRVYGIVSNLVLGGFLCLGVVFFLITATIVLSLIPLYTPNHGEEGYGEQYQIKTLFIKALYSSVPFTFLNGTIADSTLLSTVCGSVYGNQGVKNFAGCLAKNFLAFGPHNVSTNSRRRRAAGVVNVGMYEIGEINLYYSTSCPRKGDKLKYSNSTALSHCVKSRLTACNNLVNSSLCFTEWKPLPNSFSQSIVDRNGYGYHQIDVMNIFGIPFSIASSLADSLSLSTETRVHIQLGCQYIGPLPQANITDAFLSQSTATTTLPSSSGPPLG